MKFYGNADLQQNELQAAVLPLYTNFPISPKVGRLAFVNKTLFICVAIENDLPVWVPMTRELTMYTHDQQTASNIWNIEHNLNTTSVQVQVFDENNYVVIPDGIQIMSANTVQVTVSTPVTGRAMVISGQNDGNTKLTYAYIHYQQGASNEWFVQHNLGREPVTRVFIGNQEVQPLSITHDTVNSLTVRFSASYMGIVKLM